MAVLHLVSRAPGESRVLEQCLARLGKGDALLLLQNGVYAAAPAAAALREAARSHEVYLLAPDAEARGLTPQALMEAARLLDDEGFVELTLRHARILSWY